jgi:predicted RNase H-like HicB family nuclease
MPKPLARRRATRRSPIPTTKTYFFPLTLTAEDDGSFTVDVPSLPGCVTWGKTKDDALKNAEEAIAVYVEDMVACGEKIPNVEVSKTPTIALTV